MSFIKKKSILKSFITFVLIIILVLTPLISVRTVSAASTKVGYVNTTNVNLRSEPWGTYMTQLSNVYVTVLDETYDSSGNLWYKISYQNITGYMYGEYVDIINRSDPGISDPEYQTLFEEELAKFPASYQSYLKEIHEIYPNYIFIADYTGEDFWSMIDIQNQSHRKLVSTYYYPDSWKALNKDSYDWETGTWIGTAGGAWVDASYEVIAYYLDPRNFLNVNDIYTFAQLSYDPDTQTREGLEKLVSGTFLADTYDYDESNANDSKCKGSYVAVIMEAAEASGVSPYAIASKILIEQGTSGSSPLITGDWTFTDSSGNEHIGYYDYFNFAAAGTTNYEVITNGLRFALSQGWDNRYDAIVGGAEYYAANYINSGQDTYYYLDFNVINKVYWHQYTQGVTDQVETGHELGSAISGNFSGAMTFKIPIYENMLETAFPEPERSDKLNNYYFTNISVDNFDMYNGSYSLTVSGDKTITYSLPEGASYVGQPSYSLTSGYNQVKLTVMSQTGYTRDYTLNITATKDCTLYVQNSSSENLTGWVTIDGDEYLYIKGQLQTGMVTYNERVYYLGNNGKKRTGWVTFEGNTYYLLSDGTICTGWAVIDGYAYFFNNNGVLTSAFTDISECSESVQKIINTVAYNGIVKGTSENTFSPTSYCTRLQLVIMLYRFAGRPSVSNYEINAAKEKFSDLGELSSGAQKALAWAVSKGIIKGYSDGTFRPNDTVSRISTIIMLWRLLEKPEAESTATFIDISSLSSNAKTAVNWAASMGITVGKQLSNGCYQFAPDEPCQRQHIAIFIYRLACCY